MIEQQIYVKTELGLSTLSKSKGLAESYIESNIRPCYSAVDIYYLEDKAFPGFKCAVPLADGGMMIGTGVCDKGKTGAYIHSYVANSEALSVLQRKSGFFTAGAIESVKESPILPQLGDVECAEPPSYAKVFKKLNMSEGEYEALLAAVFASREQNRNVFISLDEDNVSSVTLLMARLYADLPYFLRKNVGFLTLFGEFNMRPEVNLYFISSDRLNFSGTDAFADRYNASKDYIFDNRGKVCLHRKELMEDLNGEYAELVRANIRGLLPGGLEGFFAFADEASAFLGDDRKLSLRFYDDLAYIYKMRENEGTLLTKIGRTTVIFSEVLKSGEGAVVAENYSEFIRIYRRLMKAKQTPCPIEILRRLVANFDICESKQREELYDLLTLDIELCMKSDDDEVVFNHINAMRASTELYNRITENKMMPGKGLIKRYFTYMLDKKRTIHSLMEYVDGVYQDMPKMQENEILAEMIAERAVNLYNTSGDRLEAVKYLDEKCAALGEKYPKIKQRFDFIYNYALDSAMTNLSVADMTLGQIEKFPLRGAEDICPEFRLKHRTVLAAKEILALTDDLALSFLSYDAFGFSAVSEKLSEDEKEARRAEAELKALIRRVLPEKKTAPRRMIYIILYYAFGTDKAQSHTDFDAIFAFLERENDKVPFEFIEWYLSGELYMTPITKNGRIVREVSRKKPPVAELSAFYDATVKALSGRGKELADDRETKKIKKALDKVSSLHPDYRAVTLKFRKSLNAIVRENYSPFKRIVSKITSAKNFKFAMLSVSCIVLAALGIFIGTLVAQKVNSGEVQIKNYADAKTTALSRLSWAAYKVSGEGNYIPVPGAVDDGDLTEILDLDRDDKIVISFGTETGIKIDGISVSVLLTEKSSGITVFVTDEEGRKLSVGISDYDIQSGAAVYSFSRPMTIKNIIIEPTDRTEKGNAVIRDVNAYIIRE